MSKSMATLSVEGRPPARKGRGALPKAPDVDEDKLASAEAEIAKSANPEAQRAAEQQAAVARMGGRGPRRKTKDSGNSKAGRARMLLEGPAPVIDAFNKHMETEGFKTKWDTLYDLLLKAGVEVEPFDY